MTRTLEEFMAEHNRLSPANLQVTKETLLRFQSEKEALIRKNDWSIDKLRRPLIEWLHVAALDRGKCSQPKGAGWISFPRQSEENSSRY